MTNRRRRSILSAFVLGPALLLGACSPKLDWRELKSPEGDFVAMLPGRAEHERRAVSGSPGAEMQLWTARAQDSLFAVGFADYPGAKNGLLEKTRDALVANINGRLTKDGEIVLDGARGREFRAAGPAIELTARLLLRGTRVYQIAVLAKPGALSDPELDLFFSSFQLRGGRPPGRPG
jgi:hypothetical protein